MNKPYTIIRPADHDAWLAERNNGIGSSEVATIMGCNPFQTRYQLWRRKKGLDAPVEENFAMKAGHYLEDAVSRFFSDETGLEIIKNSAGDWLAVDNARPYLRVSPDRLYWLPGMAHNTQNRGICECKTTQKAVDADNVPSHWFCQLQYQLGVTRLPAGSLAWLTQGREFGYRHFDADDEFFGIMTAEIEKFWRDYIIGDAIPAAESVDDVLAMYPRHMDGKTATATQEIVDQLEMLKGLKEQAACVDEAKKAIEDSVKLLLADAEMLVDAKGDVLATWKANKDSVKFDAKKYQAEHPDDAKAYMVTTPGARVLRIK